MWFLKKKPKRPLRVGVDVDCCVVDSGDKHIDWLLEKVGGSRSSFVEQYGSPPYPYYLPSLFEQELEYYGVDGMDFWRSDTLYDDMRATPAASFYLWLLCCLTDCEIVFVTKIKGNHHKSKCSFLKREFSFLTGIINTHEKWIMSPSLDVMIDDRAENLQPFEDRVLKIIPPNAYQQTQSVNKGIHDFQSCSEIDGWNKIVDVIMKEKYRG